MRSPTEVFAELVDGVAKLVGGDAGQVDRLAALYAEQTDVRHPMAPLGDTPLRTREDLRRHFASRPSGPIPAMAGYHAADIRVHETADPEVIVAEFTYRGASVAAPCVFVMRVRDGLIVESRDYLPHLEFARVRGQLDDLLEGLAVR